MFVQCGTARQRRHVRDLPAPQKFQRVQGGTTRERRHIRELLARPKVQRVQGGTTPERRHIRKLPAPAKFQRVQRGTTLAAHSNAPETKILFPEISPSARLGFSTPCHSPAALDPRGPVSENSEAVF